MSASCRPAAALPKAGGPFAAVPPRSSTRCRCVISTLRVAALRNFHDDGDVDAALPPLRPPPSPSRVCACRRRAIAARRLPQPQREGAEGEPATIYAAFTQFGPILDVVAVKTFKMRPGLGRSATSRRARALQMKLFYDKPMQPSYAKAKSDATSKLDGTFEEGGRARGEQGGARGGEGGGEGAEGRPAAAGGAGLSGAAPAALKAAAASAAARTCRTRSSSQASTR